MGMASSDDEDAIMKEYYLMEAIKAQTPEYGYVTHGMNEDMKAIYDHSLKEEFLNRRHPAQTQHQVSFPSYDDATEPRVTKAVRNHPRSNQAYQEREDDYNSSTSQEKIIDAEIRILKKKIEIARLKKELAELEGK